MARLVARLAALMLVAAVALVTAPVFAGDEDADGQPHQVVITAARHPALIQDEPLHVEAVPAEEVEENSTVQPGNLSTLLNELPGIRVESLAAALGGVGLELRGMPAQDTLVLSDGLPLLGTEPDAFDLLQMPPLDLERVEVVKGAASALYGGSALAGVLNLVSRPPTSESRVLGNVTSQGGSDLEGFLTSGGRSRWSGTLTGGIHYQSREDVNGDGWADIPGYRRFTLRPRVWWHDDRGDTTFLTAGVSDEDRTGGTLPGRVLPDGLPFSNELLTRRYDGGVVSHWSLAGESALDARASVTSSHLDLTFGPTRTPWIEETVFSEAAWSGTTRKHAWVLGAAFERDRLSVATVRGVGHLYNTPGVFAQDEYAPASWVKIAASARLDANDTYGTFLSPRLSALFRERGRPWSLRASIGTGFSPPTPLIEEVQETGLQSVLPLNGLHAERAITASLDAKWSDEGWDLNASVFASEIRDALVALPVGGDKFEIINAPGPRRAPGAEALIGYVEGPLEVLASWSVLSATEERTPGLRETVPLVPHQAAEIGAIFESEKRGRIGAEIGYTGRQALEYNPYRSVSEPYFELNVLGELRIGELELFANAINLTDVRQTRFDPLVRPSPGPGGDPITEVWAPLAGRTFNVGVRAEL
jgi:outer membrane receptor for ferrienterochelin and colicins